MAQVLFGDEPSLIEQVDLFGFRLLYLVEIGLGEESSVGEQAFIDRAELVDTKLRVADTPPSERGPFTGIAERFEHLLEHMVAQADAAQRGGAGVVKEIAFQRFHLKGMDQAASARPGCGGGHGHLFLGRESAVDELEQGLD